MDRLRKKGYLVRKLIGRHQAQTSPPGRNLWFQLELSIQLDLSTGD